MAASRSMLESLLARVRQRATEPRQPSLVSPPSARPRDIAAAPAAFSRPLAPVVADDDGIEEYDEELIEIIDDSDVDSEIESQSSPEIRPLELSASAPSVEMRRRVLPPEGGEPASTGVATVAPAARAPAPAAAVSSPEALSSELVSRKPIKATNVVHSQGARRDLRAASFMELLDSSLKLGG